MTSKQPVQTHSQAVAGVIPASPAIKDSPAVERALNRSKLYLLVSWSQLYPEDEEFLDYVQCGEFVEDGRAALDTLGTTLDGIGGERAKLKLVLLRKQFDQIVLSVAMLLEHLGRPEDARRVEQAVALDLSTRGTATRSTSQVGDAISTLVG